MQVYDLMKVITKIPKMGNTIHIYNNYVISSHDTVGFFCGAPNTVEQLTPSIAWYKSH